jgi:hypothetical protein
MACHPAHDDIPAIANPTRRATVRERCRFISWAPASLRVFQHVSGQESQSDFWAVDAGRYGVNRKFVKSNVRLARLAYRR